MRTRSAGSLSSLFGRACARRKRILWVERDKSFGIIVEAQGVGLPLILRQCRSLDWDWVTQGSRLDHVWATQASRMGDPKGRFVEVSLFATEI
jgi:hypothetical protein